MAAGDSFRKNGDAEAGSDEGKGGAHLRCLLNDSWHEAGLAADPSPYVVEGRSPPPSVGNERLLRELFERGTLVARQAMILSENEREGFTVDQGNGYSSLSQGHADEARVQGAVAQRLHLRNGRQILQFQFHPGILLAKGKYDGGHDLQRHRGNKTDAEMAHLASGDARHA